MKMKNIIRIFYLNSLLKITKTSYVILLVTVLLCFSAFKVLAQLQAIDDGVAWLNYNQNFSGSWGNPDKAEFRDTTEVVNVLKKVGTTGSQYDNALNYIINQANVNNSDYIARKAKVLAQNGNNISDLIDDLLSIQNPVETNNAYYNYPEGGWGIAKGYSTNCLDTALALDALVPRGLLILNKSVALGETQDYYFDYPANASDIGIYISDVSGSISLRLFPDVPLGNHLFESITVPTSLNLEGITIGPGRRQIQIYGEEASIYSFGITFAPKCYNSSVSINPIAYLIQAQNTDGGWGLSKGDDSNVFITASVLLTLENFTECAFETTITNGVQWLISNQNADGGFGAPGSTIYETALSYLAIINSNPSLPNASQARTFIENSQQGNGSWGNDAYQTAMAIRALSGAEVDRDMDGIPDVLDNCPTKPNSFILGTCKNIKTITYCNSDDDCGGVISSCSMDQEDTFPPQGNGCGDVCECEGNFDEDQDQDGTDAFTFKQDFGRSRILDPCTNADLCNGDFTCDNDVDGTDAFTFKSDFGRSNILNRCPNCATILWCVYP